MLALGGFRIGTLIKLQYRHVRRDLEKGITPIHIHVESEITKGKYHDYDTFLSQEVADYLRAYLEIRRQGTQKIPPEHIHDASPLIRNQQSKQVLPIATSSNTPDRSQTVRQSRPDHPKSTRTPIRH